MLIYTEIIGICRCMRRIERWFIYGGLIEGGLIFLWFILKFAKSKKTLLGESSNQHLAPCFGDCAKSYIIADVPQRIIVGIQRVSEYTDQISILMLSPSSSRKKHAGYSDRGILLRKSKF